MPEDEKVVQSGAVSEETVSKEEAVPPKGEIPPQPLPLTEERLQQILTQERQKFAEERERIKQSSRDALEYTRKEVDTALSRARFAEQTSADLTRDFGELNPEQAETIKTKAQLKAYQLRDVEETQAKQLAVSREVFFEGMAQSVTTLGIDPYDKRIDWAQDAPNPQVASQRILDSVARIQKEDGKKATDKLEQRLKDLETKSNKEIDSVNTAATPPAVGSDAEFLDKFGRGEVPATKENIQRADKILKKLEKGE